VNIMLKRISNLFRGFFGLAVSSVEVKNPEALLEVETENLRKQVAQYNQGLASHAGLCERLMGQIRKLEADQQDLRAKTAANLKVGNLDAAGQYALRLQTIDRELTENRKQVEQAEATYRDLVKARDVAVQAAKQKIESLRSTIGDMKMKKAQAELTEMASGMISEIGGGGDTLERLQSMVEAERDKAAGRVRVARDTIDTAGVNLKETEQRALGQQALADFAAKEGIAMDLQLPAPHAADTPPKLMGPGSKETA